MQPEFLEVEDVLQIHITRNHPLPTSFERIRFGECGAWLGISGKRRAASVTLAACIAIAARDAPHCTQQIR